VRWKFFASQIGIARRSFAGAQFLRSELEIDTRNQRAVPCPRRRQGGVRPLKSFLRMPHSLRVADGFRYGLWKHSKLATPAESTVSDESVVSTKDGDKPQIPTKIPQGKPLAERLPSPWSAQPSSVAVQVSFTFRFDASPVHNRSDRYVSLDFKPSGNV
jgi:hypothetical protein